MDSRNNMRLPDLLSPCFVFTRTRGAARVAVWSAVLSATCRLALTVGLLSIALTTGVAAAEVRAQSPSEAEGRIPQYGWRLDGDAFLRLGEGLETPHTKWASPLPSGPVRALFIANSDAAYDVPELARRLDLSVHGMPADTWLRLGGNYWLWLWLESSSSTERGGILEAMLDEPYDVIVLGNFRFASLYETIQLKILQKVAAGCGLVMFYPHDHEAALTRQPIDGAGEDVGAGIPFAGLDQYRNLFMLKKDLLWPDQVPGELIKGYQFGKGRVLLVDYVTQHSVFAAVPGCITPFEPYDYTAPVQYDYHQALAARALLWAAGRQPRLIFSTALPDGLETDLAGDPPVIAFSARWNGPANAGLTRRTRIRNRWGDVEADTTERFRVRRGEASWSLALPRLPAGDHFVDILISSGEGVENWGSFTVHTRSALQIAALETPSNYVGEGESVEGRILLSRPVRAGESAAVDLVLEDGYGRVFSRQTVAAPEGSDRVDFVLPRGAQVSWGARLRAALRVDGEPIHRDEIELRMWRESRGDYPIAMWGAIAGYGNHIGNLQMRELGFTAILENEPLHGARDDIGWMTFGAGKGALIHSLGDEIPIPRPPKGQALSNFMRDRYGDLDALNAAWARSYTDWSEIEPAPAVTDGSPASFVRYHDWLSCGEFLFAEMCRTRREDIEKTNPRGVVGPEGSPVGNPEWTLKQTTFWGPYLTVRDNLLVNALAKPGTLRGNWYGGYVEDRQVETRLRHVLWLSILGGNNMIEYFTVASGLLAPDLTLMPFTAQFLDSWREIRNGVGPQLALCRPAGNPVAVLHSQPSEHAGSAGGEGTDTAKVHEAFFSLLGDAGYAPQMVASGQVEAGRLRDGDVRVLCLLNAYALSDREMDEITAFARRGGVVLADIPPAWFDEGCRLREVRALDEFFGVAPVRPQASMTARLRAMDAAHDLPCGDQVFRLRGADPTLDAGLFAYGPLVREHGDGRSILLNGVLWKDAIQDRGSALALRRLLEALAGVPRTFEVEYVHDLGRLGSKVYTARHGEIEIDAVLPPEATDPRIPVIPSVVWPETRHTYNLRQPEYLGDVDALQMEVDRSAPLLVARLPYRVEGVSLEAPDAAAPGAAATVRCGVRDEAGATREGHILRIQVFGPDGEERPYYGAWVGGGEAAPSWTIPFALNDAAGPWRVRATDMISGVSAEAAIALRAGN